MFNYSVVLKTQLELKYLQHNHSRQRLQSFSFEKHEVQFPTLPFPLMFFISTVNMCDCLTVPLLKVCDDASAHSWCNHKGLIQEFFPTYFNTGLDGSGGLSFNDVGQKTQ